MSSLVVCAKYLGWNSCLLKLPVVLILHLGLRIPSRPGSRVLMEQNPEVVWPLESSMSHASEHAENAVWRLAKEQLNFKNKIAVPAVSGDGPQVKWHGPRVPLRQVEMGVFPPLRLSWRPVTLCFLFPSFTFCFPSFLVVLKHVQNNQYGKVVSFPRSSNRQMFLGAPRKQGSEACAYPRCLSGPLRFMAQCSSVLAEWPLPLFTYLQLNSTPHLILEFYQIIDDTTPEIPRAELSM